MRIRQPADILQGVSAFQAEESAIHAERDGSSLNLAGLMLC